MIEDRQIRRLFTIIIEALLDDLAQDHYDAATQEPPLTARAGERLEGARVVGLPEGYGFKIITLDIPDRVPGAWEKKSGTDLYVGIETTINGVRTSKGILVQAKWDWSRTEGESDRLSVQCRKMLKISDSAYVWSYGKNRITVEDARKFVDDTKPSQSRSIGSLFDAVLACNEGDERLGLPVSERPRVALGGMLERLLAPAGISFQIEVDSSQAPPDEITISFLP